MCYSYFSTIANQLKVLSNLIVSNPFIAHHLYCHLASLGLHYFMLRLWHWLLNMTHKILDNSVLAHLSCLNLCTPHLSMFSFPHSTMAFSLSRLLHLLFPSLNILHSAPLLLENSSFSLRRSQTKTIFLNHPMWLEVSLQSLALWTTSTRALKYCMWLSAYLSASCHAIDYCVPGTRPSASMVSIEILLNDWLNQWRKH